MRARTPAFPALRVTLLLAGLAGWCGTCAAAEEPPPPPPAAGEHPLPPVGGGTPEAGTSAVDLEDPGMAKDLAGWLGKAVDASGKMDKAAYAREARAWGVQAISRRLGPDYDFYHKGAKPEVLPTLPQPETHLEKRGHRGQGMPYQYGTFDAKVDNTFGSTGGQVYYVPERADDPGVDRIESYEWGNNLISLAPTAVWWGGSHPDPALPRREWQEVNGGPLRCPVAMGRSRTFWSNDALMLFSDGFLGADGTQTSGDSFPCLLFPKNKVPTAVAVTNGNELGLVALWDLQSGKGEVAVVALQGTNLRGWRYYCLPTYGSYSQFKILGYIELPGMAAPTGISCATNNRQGLVENKEFGAYKLEDHHTREIFTKGDGKDKLFSAGYAVVISRSEGKAVFIDLQPTIEYLRLMYLTSDENLAKTVDTGPAAKQWPPTFATVPGYAPKVVTSVRVPHPSVVLAGTRPFAGEPWLCHIGTLDGRIATWTVGGLATEAPAKPDDVKAVGVTQVGRTPTSMVFLRNSDPAAPGSNPYEYNRTLAVCCRGDREIDFVTFTAAGKGTVYRRLRDARLIDPVVIDPCERAPLITVGDFRGRKVVNYRYGPTPDDHAKPAHSFAVGPDGKGDVECGGVLEFPGPVFDVNTTNVN